MSDWLLRHERPEDVPAIHAVNRAAFARDDEADLVDRLRTAGAATLSLVAIEEGVVIGHILFSPVRLVRESGTTPAIGLAPMAVLPAHQSRGVGSALVRRGLDDLRAAGHGGVIVLGHPEYYPRFGFMPASRFGLRWVQDVPDEAFMGLELVAGGLGSGPGVVHYHAAIEGM